LVFLEGKYPDLAVVVEAWPDLSEAVRADVIAKVNATRQGNSAEDV